MTIIEKLQKLNACTESLDAWVADAVDSGQPLESLWEMAVAHHIGDAWWLAARLGVATPALHDCVRRALQHAADACDKAGVDSAALRRQADSSELDLDAARAVAWAARGAAWAAARDAGDAARDTAWAAAWAARDAAWAAGAARDAAWAAELELQRKALRELYPELLSKWETICLTM